MKAAFKFEGEAREQTGRGEARALRRDGKVPAILYSKRLAPVSFALSKNELTREYKKGGFLSKLIEFSVGGKQYYALPRDLQMHPVTDQIEHADFLEVDANSTVNVRVPMRVINTERCAGVRRGGNLNLVRHYIELLCRPDAIPSAIEVDVLNANIGDSIHIEDISLPEGVTPVIQDRNFTLVTIAGRMAEREETSETTEATEDTAEKKE